MFSGMDTAYALAKKYKIKTAWGRRHAGLSPGQVGSMLFPGGALAMATSGNAELLALSGLRSPYSGKIGGIQEGALADLLPLDGDPLANINLVENAAKHLVVIMMDGKIYKNALK